uniref:Uncharacterized protein n=1 Tax=Salvator merianae TaxID=96440 RepID=A0A8D0DUI0_SALMN
AMDCQACVMAKTEKIGQKYHVALRLWSSIVNLICTLPTKIHNLSAYYTHTRGSAQMTVAESYSAQMIHTGRDLKGRTQKIPGVPIMFIFNHKRNILYTDKDGIHIL